MKKMIFKQLGFIFTACTLLVILSVAMIGVNAEAEKESNNTAPTATAISVNTPVSGAISTSSDVDWYKFTVNESGYFYVEFNHTLLDISRYYWAIRLYDSTGVNLLDGSTGYYSVAANANAETSVFGVSAGTYYVKIERSSHSTEPYSINVKFTPTDTWEVENNNDKSKATEIGVNEEYGGALSSSDDVDWYKFTVNDQGYFNVEFLHELLSNSSTYWQITLYDSTGVYFIDGSDDRFTVQGNKMLTTSNIGIKAGTYYIKIARSAFLDYNYSIKVNFTPTSNRELENNGDKNAATQIEINNPYYGSISTAADTDWYKFTVSEDGYFYVDFTHELFESGSVYWNIQLYDSTGIDFINGIDSKYTVYGKKNLTTPSIGVPAGTYYIKIFRSSHSSIDYCVKVNFTATSDWESENNGSKENADDIKLNKMYGGAIMASGDVDWYKFDVGENSEIAVSFSHNAYDSNSVFWIVDVMDSSGVKSLYSYNVRGSEANFSSEYITFSPGIYYIKVRQSSYLELDYRLAVIQKHDCNGEFVTVKAPTCTESGIEEKLCTVCGATLETRGCPAIGHMSDNWITDAEPTCNREGKKHGDCSVCGEKVVEVIVKLDHKFGSWTVRNAAKCEESGLEERFCELCSGSEERTIEPLDHKYDEWKTISGNIVIPPIIREHRCELCGETESIRDWGYVWVTVLAGLAVIGLCVGVVAYFKAYR